MSRCLDCASSNYDEAYKLAREQAKQKAVKDGQAVALWMEGSEWYYGSAANAVTDGKPIREFVSHL